MDNCEIYAVFTVVVTALWVYYGRHWSFPTLALAMFFPGIFAPWFSMQADFIQQVMGFNVSMNTIVQMSVCGGVLSILIISGVVVIDHILGWGSFDERYKTEDPGDLVSGFLRAAGEEVGWRCFLLPCLVNKYGPICALIISGLVWGLYHIPVMLLLVHRCKTPHPHQAVIAQFCSVAFSAVPHGWLAIKSGYAFWAPTVMHWTWNRLNPVATGSIYTNVRGKVNGPLWLVNGEGVAGCLILAPVSVLILASL